MAALAALAALSLLAYQGAFMPKHKHSALGEIFSTLLCRVDSGRGKYAYVCSKLK